jgi:hypothetical protein
MLLEYIQRVAYRQLGVCSLQVQAALPEGIRADVFFFFYQLMVNDHIILIN